MGAVTGKIHPYKKEYNLISILDNTTLQEELIKYCIGDTVALFNAMLKAQETYLYKYRVDICTIVSTSSLALKIFIKKYKEIEIPVLNSNTDSFIRQSYFGGATDYYTCTNENLKYYLPTFPWGLDM